VSYEVYLAECPEGRRYVGCSKHGAAYRWRTHFGKPPRPWPTDGTADVADAIKRFGREAFTLTVLARVDDPMIAAAIETAMIAHFDCCRPRGYNGAAKSNLARATTVFGFTSKAA